MVIFAFINVVNMQLIGLKTFLAQLANKTIAVSYKFFDVFIKPKCVREGRSSTFPHWVVCTIHRFLNCTLKFMTTLATAKYMWLFNGRCSPNWFSTRITWIPLTNYLSRIWTALSQVFTISATKDAGMFADMRWLAGKSLTTIRAFYCAFIRAIPSAYLILCAQLRKTFWAASTFALFSVTGLKRHLCLTDSTSNRNLSLSKFIGTYMVTKMILIGNQTTWWSINWGITV